MHTNPAFRATSTADNLAFARQRGFGILMLNGVDGPLASHIPFHLADDGRFADLHLTRSNPIARSALPGPAMLVVSGPDAYISPDWYGLDDQVPTWNYVAVHLRGTLTALDLDGMKDHVDALSEIHETRLLPKKPWHSDKMTEDAIPRMMRMILPFRLTIASVEGTWKLNQNKPDAARERAANHLAEQADAGSKAIAALMRDLPKG
jgi:transcriptional regulator